MAWFQLFKRNNAQKPSAAVSGKFIQLAGRTYSSEVPYVLPKDDTEISRLDFQHFMLRYVRKGNYEAPMLHPHDIFDIGCGSGRWAMEMAIQFPMAHVVGVDIVEPNVEAIAFGNGLSHKPDNYVFVRSNILEGLTFADNSFDYVHVSLLYSAIPAVKYPEIMQEIWRIMTPGGWFEWVEGGVEQGGAPAMDLFRQWTIEGGAKFGLDMQVGLKMGDMLRAAGFSNIRANEFPIPIGAYGGRIGEMMQTNLYLIYNAGKGMSVKSGVASLEAYNTALQNWPAEVNTVQSVFRYYSVIGQKLV